MAEPAAPDFTHLARKPSERLAIVKHVRDSPGLEETDYLEWKSSYDLSTKSGAASTARQLIGMANRDVAQAERHADGSAYILIGVEPGAVHGVEHWDSADIENWLSRYVEAELRYDIHYVELDGKEVLFFIVDAPRQGDPIFCLQRQYDVVKEGAASGAGGAGKVTKTLPKGAIYVRHGGKTEQHTPDDLKRLGARLHVNEAPTLDLALELDASKAIAIPESLASDLLRDERLRSWRAEMLAKLPRRETGYQALTAFQFGGRPLGEKRTEEQYRTEIDSYVQTVKGTPGMWLHLLAVDWVKERRSELGVSIKNNTDKNYEHAVVELVFSDIGRGNIYLQENEPSSVLALPEKPEKWGADNLVSLMARTQPVITPIGKPRPELEQTDSGQVLVRFPELRVRPHTPHRLAPILLALAPSMAGTAISVHWRVTASNAISHQEGDLEFRVPGGADAFAESESDRED